MVDALVLWLRDTWHSGKRLQLAVFMTANDQPPASYALHNMPADSASSIENVFEAWMIIEEVVPGHGCPASSEGAHQHSTSLAQ